MTQKWTIMLLSNVLVWYGLSTIMCILWCCVTQNRDLG